MTPETLIQRLRHPQAAVRLETLQILAMVEETRALQVVGWIYRHDPEPRVRQAALWAGRILRAAQQRGYSTETAMAEHFNTEISADREELFLEGAARSLAGSQVSASKKKQRFDPELEAQRLRAQRAMLDAIQKDGSAATAADNTAASLLDLASDLLDDDDLDGSGI